MMADSKARGRPLDLVSNQRPPDRALLQESQNPIFRLPPEILSNIFVQNVLQLPAQRGRYYGLFGFLFVCWRWYHVARSSPHLWCHLGNNIYHWPTFLALSKKLALYVHVYDDCDEYSTPLDDRVSDAIYGNLDFYSRIREFTYDGEQAILSHILPNSTTCCPSRLVSLSIVHFTAGPWEHRFGAIILERLVEPSSESLRRLSISGWTLQFDRLPMVRQLTHLSLTDFYSPLDIKNLLFFLQANAGLEELLLNYGTRRTSGDDYGGELPLVSLTHLRKLRLTLIPRHVDPLFKHLRIESEVEEVEVKIAGYQGWRSKTACRWFNDTVSPCAVQCIEARSSSHLLTAMKYVQKSDSIQHPNLPHHTAFVEVRFGSSALCDFFALQVLRNVTRMELFHDHLLTWQYLTLFERVPALQELVIWAGWECNSVRALLPAVQNSQEVEGGTILAYVPLPNLSHLRIIEADLGDTGDNNGFPNEAVISDLVRERKQLKSGLQRLELICCNYVSPDWVEELLSFVPEVFWDGRDGTGWIYSDILNEDYSPSSPEPEDLESGDSNLESDGSGEEGTTTSVSTNSIHGF